MTLPWDDIDTVLLDMDGTILDLHFDNYFWLEYLPEYYAEQNGMSVEQAKEYLYNQFNTLRGTLNWYCLDYWSDTLSIDIPALKRTIEHKVAFRPQAIEFLEYINRLEKDVYLVTNAHWKSLEIKMLNTQFHQYFHDLISSHDYGAPKEEQRFWQTLQSNIDFKKENALFIDDSAAVLASAKRYGIGFVYGIAQPDSYQPARDIPGFPCIEHYRDIMGN